jgi:protein-tyrosine-phosphatase
MPPAPRSTACSTRRSRRSSASSVDTSEFFVRPVSRDILAGADVIVTMGHSVGKVELPEEAKHEDWRVGDPVGASMEETRRVRDDIERRVRALLVELGVRPSPDASKSPGGAGAVDIGDL